VILLPLLAPILAAAAPVVAPPVQGEGLGPTDPTFRAIAAADGELFGASNACDLETFASLIDEDFEFYHDRTGLTVGREALVEATRANLCHKVRRTLVGRSLRVFPLANYGALEMGEHRFCNLVETPGCRPEREGSAKFVMLWRSRPGGYRLARVISYDHVDR